MLLRHNLVVRAPSRPNINNRLLVRRDAVSPNDIILAQGLTRWTGCRRTQATCMLQGQKLLQLVFRRFPEINLPKVDDCVGMRGANDFAGDIGLDFGEDSEGVRHYYRLQWCSCQEYSWIVGTWYRNDLYI